MCSLLHKAPGRDRFVDISNNNSYLTSLVAWGAISILLELPRSSLLYSIIASLLIMATRF